MNAARSPDLWTGLRVRNETAALQSGISGDRSGSTVFLLGISAVFPRRVLVFG